MAGSAADDERAAAAGIDHPLHVGGARAERSSHACKICGAEFSSGVSRGGHMRKHYVPTKQRLRLSPAELALASSLQQWAPPSPEDPVAAPPPPPLVPAGCVRLFGVNIVVVQQAKEEAPVEEQ